MVGYMPQVGFIRNIQFFKYFSHYVSCKCLLKDIALNRDFYVSEILNYFGMLYKMNTYQIESRKKFLINLLDMPKKDKMISNLR